MVTATNSVSMPEIGTVKDVAAFLKYAPKTIYKWTSARLFPPGVVIGRGRYNLSRLRDYIATKNRFLIIRGAE